MPGSYMVQTAGTCVALIVVTRVAASKHVGCYIFFLGRNASWYARSFRALGPRLLSVVAAHVESMDAATQ